MARPLRINFPGALYHLTVRGNNKKDILKTDDDRFHFLRLLGKTVESFQWICYAYCLMSNHFHLLIETSLANLSQGMKFLNGAYAQFFNWTHGRVGHLYQGRFGSILIEKQAHLLEVCRYVELNPVRARMCAEPEDYAWSSYRAHCDLAPKPSFLNSDAMLALFGAEREKALAHYQRFVKEGKEDRPFDKVKGQIFLGSDAFISQFQDMAQSRKGIPRTQTLLLRPSAENLLSAPNGLLVAHDQYGYSASELAAVLNIHQTTVSRRIKEARQISL